MRTRIKLLMPYIKSNCTQVPTCKSQIESFLFNILNKANHCFTKYSLSRNAQKYKHNIIQVTPIRVSIMSKVGIKPQNKHITPPTPRKRVSRMDRMKTIVLIVYRQQ